MKNAFLLVIKSEKASQSSARQYITVQCSTNPVDLENSELR